MPLQIACYHSNSNGPSRLYFLTVGLGSEQHGQATIRYLLKHVQLVTKVVRIKILDHRSPYLPSTYPIVLPDNVLPSL